MPGISIACSWPSIVIFIPAGSASGTGWPRSRSHCCMLAISSCWALMIRSASRRTEALAPWVGAQPAITMAWAWWPIMPDMKCTSASVWDTGRPAEARPAPGEFPVPAQPVTIGRRMSVVTTA